MCQAEKIVAAMRAVAAVASGSYAEAVNSVADQIECNIATRGEQSAVAYIDVFIHERQWEVTRSDTHTHDAAAAAGYAMAEAITNIPA